MEGPDTLVADTEDALSHLVIEGSTPAPITPSDAKEPLQTLDGPEIDEASEVDVDGNETVAEDGDGILGENGNGVVVENGNGNGCDGEYVEEMEKQVERDDDAAEYLNKDDGIENGNGIACEDGEGGIAAEDEDEEGEGGAEDEDGDAAVDGDAEESSSGEDGIADEETDPDDDSALFDDDDEDLNNEVQYTEEQIQSLLDEFVEAEEEAAEAQENLEEESLECTREAVFEELSESLTGPELEAAVTEEMTTYMAEWEDRLASLEDQISLLQEKLDDAGENLPELYKWLEKQIPERCTTEAWRKRTHWAGLIPTTEVFEAVKMAEKELTAQRPVRRRHGRAQDEGASGFLMKKVPANPDGITPPEDGWALVDFLDKEENPGPGHLMGTEKWATVYLASTPEQAALLGLSLPGVDTVEEIGDMESDKSKLFKEALANEKNSDLEGKQKIVLKKVREEDDVKKTKKLQERVLPRRPRKSRTPYVRRKADLSQSKFLLEASSSGAAAEENKSILQVVLPFGGKGLLQVEEKPFKVEGNTNLEQGLEQELNAQCKVEVVKAESVEAIQENDDRTGMLQKPKPSCEPWIIDGEGVVYLDGACTVDGQQTPDSQEEGAEGSLKQLKRRLTASETEAENNDAKRLKTTVVIDSDGEREEVEECARAERLPRDDVGGNKKSEGVKSSKEIAEVVVLGSRKDSSQQVQLEKSRSQDEDYTSAEDYLKVTKKRRGSYIQEPRDFSCTACGMMLKKREVLRHPQLEVCICRKCKNFLFSGPFHKDKDGSEDECRWCGQGGDVLCCESCDKVFCTACIVRNLGDEGLEKISNTEDWKCFFCNKEPLNDLRQQYKLVKEAMKAQMLQDSDVEFVNETEGKTKRKHPGRGRRNIRRVLDDKELDEKTKSLLALEKERTERLEMWKAKARANGTGTPVKPNRHKQQAHYNAELLDMDEDDIAKEGYILNKARQEDEEAVRIAPSISDVLRPHQLAGLRFMWENCIESVSKVKSGVNGLGCILAHSMGLGKTLQVIAFIHTVLKRANLGLQTVLIVVPVNVLHNWRSEFGKWQPADQKPIAVYMLEDVSRDNFKRAKLLSKWHKCGGVMLIGYTAFRNLSMGKTIKEKSIRDDLCLCLQHPGPDILVCDEAHMIKNRKADITQALRQVRTHRRIALTGSPLQNNLMEYYCMVDFVREGFLGPAPSFKRRFQNPIENGQRADSTTKDVKIMKHRAHVLHKQLQGFVQRKTMSVLKDELPSKCVYVISVRLSPLQRALYLKFLETFGLQNGTLVKQSGKSFLFEAYHTLAKIWNHPDLLLLAQEEKDLRKEDDVENFTVDIDDDVPDVVEVPNGDPDGGVIILNDNADTGGGEEIPKEGKNKPSNVVRTLCRGNGEQYDADKAGWWREIMEGQPRESVEFSGKMVILMKILSVSSQRHDKALVFSQSLHTLDLIEKFLESTPCYHGFRGNWRKNRDWYRLDGQTSAKARQELVESFNDPDNTSVQCVLISTRAGSLGINLPAANRVVIFDGSWNPTHDLQALFRAWRFGQTKPVYAYRLLASGTMEEKIYNRQVAKEGLAARVLDEHQVGRYFVEDDLEFLFVLDDDAPESDSEGSEIIRKSETPQTQNSTAPSTSVGMVPTEEGGIPLQTPAKVDKRLFSIPDDAPPKDDIMGKLLLEYRPKWILRYHEHEPLLEDLEDEKLSKEEQSAAWESFQQEGPEWMAPLVAPIAGAPQPSNSQPIYTSAAQNTPLPVYTFPSPAYNISSNPQSSAPAQGKSSRCVPLTHVRQLQAEEIKAGSSTICGICNEIITWETLKRS